MVKMTKNSAVGSLLEPIENSAIWKSVLCEAVLCEAQVYRQTKRQKYDQLCMNFMYQEYASVVSMYTILFCLR